MLELLEELKDRGVSALVVDWNGGDPVAHLEPPGGEARIPEGLLEGALAFAKEEAEGLFEEKGLFAAAEGEGRVVFDLARGKVELSWRLRSEEEHSIGSEVWEVPLRVVLRAPEGEGEPIEGEGEVLGRSLRLEGLALPCPEGEVLEAVERALAEGVLEKESEDLEVLGLVAWKFPFRFLSVPEKGVLVLEGVAAAKVLAKRYCSLASEEEGTEAFDLVEWLRERALEKTTEV